MRPWLLPSGLQRGIPFIIPDDWSPEQALAMVELLDDLRHVIWERYQLQLQELLSEQHCSDLAENPKNIEEDDPPF